MVIFRAAKIIHFSETKKCWPKKSDYSICFLLFMAGIPPFCPVWSPALGLFSTSSTCFTPPYRMAVTWKIKGAKCNMGLPIWAIAAAGGANDA